MSIVRIPLSFVLAGILTISSVQAADDWNVDGEHGELHVYGALIESSCRLGMRSEFQQIMIDITALTSLHKPGEMGKPSNFTLRLLGCQRVGGEQRNRTNGTVVWDSIQPVITISFAAVLDADNPSLMKMQGSSGLGLLIRDSHGRVVRPGERGQPQFITPGSNQLVYSVTPVRTSAPLVTGPFRTVVNFGVSYD